MAGGDCCLIQGWKSLFGRKQSSEAKARKVDAEEEGVRRVWGSGAMRDVLPAVFQFLPSRERFLVQRVSRLFEGTSETARLAVGELELKDTYLGGNEKKKFNFMAKILDPNAFDGITSLRLSQEWWYPCWSVMFWSTEKRRYESRLKKDQRRCEEALGKLSLPTLRHVSLCPDPLTQSLLPFLRSHPSLSSLELRMYYDHESDMKSKEFEMIAEGLSEAKIRKLTIYNYDLEFFSNHKEWRKSLFANVEELSLHGVKLRNLDFLPQPSKLTSLHYLIYACHGKLNASFLDQASGLRFLSLSFFCLSRTVSFTDVYNTEIAKGLQGLPLESLQFNFLICTQQTGHVMDFVESLTSGGETSNLAMSLQELTVRISCNNGSFDMSVFNTDAFLRFPRLHSLRLRMGKIIGPPLTLVDRNALSVLPVFKELNQRLRVLEIAVQEV